MKFRKTIFYCLLATAATAAGYFTFTSQTDYQLNQATNSFKEKKYDDVLNILGNIKVDIPSSCFHLYSSYTAQALGKLDQSNAQLEKALSARLKEICPSTDASDSILREIQINQMMNDYANHQYDSFSRRLKNVLQANHNQACHHLAYFKGLEHYYNHRFQEALAIWDNLPKEKISSEWLDNTFTRWVREQKIDFQILLCRLELGDMHHIKAIIEQNSKYKSDLTKDEYAFLMGLAYVKIAKRTNLETSISYYKTADTLFNSISKGQDLSIIEKKHLRLLYKKMFLSLLDKQTDGIIDVLVNKLESLEAEEELQDLARICTKEIKARPSAFRSMLSRHLSSSSILKKKIASNLENELHQCLKNNLIPSGRQLWPQLVSFSDNLEEIKERASLVCQEKILANLNQDDTILSKTLPLIYFWNEFCKKTNQSPLIGEQIVYLSGSLWTLYNQPEKAQALMLLAEELSDEDQRDNILKAVTHELQIATSFAKEYNSFNTLSLIYKTLGHFHITSIKMETEGEIVNRLADTTYLFEQGRYEEVVQRTKWILCLEPKNETAQRLLGFAYYKQSKYDLAISSLLPLSPRYPQIAEITGICLIKSGELSQGQDMLIKASKQHALSDESFYYLGKLETSPKQIVNWLEKIKKPNAEVWARLFIAYHSLKDWQSAIGYYQKLPQEYSKLNALQMMAIECFLALNQNEYVEILLDAMKPEDQFEQSFPPFHQTST